MWRSCRLPGVDSANREAVKMGVFYALEKLDPIVFVPMHGGDNTIKYREYSDEVREKGFEIAVAAVKNRGDRFHYRRGSGLEFLYPGRLALSRE
jgi:hypothetical protein